MSATRQRHTQLESAPLFVARLILTGAALFAHRLVQLCLCGRPFDARLVAPAAS